MDESTQIKEIKQKIIPVLKEYKISKASIFGSYARGEQTKKSDVDLLVELDNNLSLLDVIGIKLELEKALKKKVDLVEYENIRPEIKENILTDEIRIL